MSTQTTQPTVILKLLGVMGAGALLASCFYPYNLPYIMPLALTAFIGVLLREQNPRHAFYYGLVFGCVYFGGTLFWLNNLFGTGAIPLIIIISLFMGLFALCFIWIRKQLPWIPIWISAPILWTAIEIYRSEFFVLKFSWMGLGYGVVNYPWLAYPASWFGSYFISFIVVLLGALLLKYPIPEKGLPIRYPFLILVWISLFFLPKTTAIPRNPLQVRLVQTESGRLDLFDKLSNGDGKVNADFIVMPEYSVLYDPFQSPSSSELFINIAKQNSAYLIFGGVKGEDQSTIENTAYVLSPDGVIVGTHQKNHTVHFFQDGVPGTKAKAISTKHGKIGVGICFDFDFPDVSRRLTQDGAEVLLVPNMDSETWGSVQREQHRLTFQMRALECGRWLARADVAGGTSVSAPNGQEVFRVKTTKDQLADVIVGRQSNKTLYIRGGWRYSQFMLTVGALLMIWSFLPKKYRIKEKEQS